MMRITAEGKIRMATIMMTRMTAMGAMLMAKLDEDKGTDGDVDAADPSNDRGSSGESLRVVPVCQQSKDDDDNEGDDDDDVDDGECNGAGDD